MSGYAKTKITVTTKPTKGAKKVNIGDFGYIYVIGVESKEFKLLRENRPKDTL